MNPHHNPDARVIWAGEHKNSVRATVTRHSSHCWTVTMSDRYIYGVTVTCTTVKEAWHRALTAIIRRAV